MLELTILRYVLRKDEWDAGFSENRKMLFTLFVNAIFVCNTRVVLLNMLGNHVIFQSMFIKYCFSTKRTLGRIYILLIDVWNGGFPENRKILFTLFVNVIL